MNKRGQFYLVAAIIIIGVVFGFFSTKSYVKAEGDIEGIKVYDLSNELKEEGARVIDCGIYPNELSINELMGSFTEDIATKYLGEKAQDITFIYGNREGIMKKEIWEEEEKGTITTGPGMGVIVKRKELKEIYPYPANTMAVKVFINEQPYDFELKAGENFYIIIEKEVGDEIYIEKR